MKKRKKWSQLVRRGLTGLLTLAMVSTTVLTDGVALNVKAEEPVVSSEETYSISGIKSGGYQEGAYVEWEPVTGSNGTVADGYEVYVAKCSADAVTEDTVWTKLDEELIRNYGTYLRADALGLTEGTWSLKVEAATFNSSKEKLATLVESAPVQVEVTAHDRSGFAWTNGTSSGAYNEDGSLKENAQVIYITEDTKDTVELEVKGVSGTVTGLQAIFNAYKKGKAEKPLDVRIIGKITNQTTTGADVKNADWMLETGENGVGVTIEGVGEDATIFGSGIQVSKSCNVEIRNLGFMCCNSTEGDNVSLVQDNNHIWVHNCDFFYGEQGSDDDQKKGDGMLDCKLSNYVTFSYNHFWDSGKSSLLGLKEGTNDLYITYHHNWFDHSDSRHPRVRYYNVHVYNNYYDGNAKYGIGGALGGGSIFAENNYFRNCKYPMLISMQGSDVWDESQGKNVYTKNKATFTKEDGSLIKAYNNYMVGQTRFIAYAKTDDENTAWDETVDFDAYVVTDKTETVPDTVKTLEAPLVDDDTQKVSNYAEMAFLSGTGGNTYSNFDTAEDCYIKQEDYKLDEVEKVPDIVKASAGRLNGGDFKFTFDDATEDTLSTVNTELKAKLEAYETTLVSVGGILSASVKQYCTVTFDYDNGTDETIVNSEAEINQKISQPADPTVNPEGFAEFDGWYDTATGTKWNFNNLVTGELTLKAHYLTSDEVIVHGGTPIGTEQVVHNFVESGVSSIYFNIDGALYTKNGTSANYNDEGTVTGHGLTMASATITFTTTTQRSKLVLVMATGSSSKVSIDGTVQSATGGILETVLSAGEHTLTGNGTGYLFKIYVIPVNVPEGTVYTITVNNGYNENTSEVKVTAGDELTSENLATPTREGYTFTGWTDGDGKEIYLPYEPEGDMTVTATWLKNSSGSGSSDQTKLYNMKLTSADLTATTYTDSVSKNGFTVTADSGHSVVVDATGKKIGEVNYPGRIKTSGSGSAMYRSITFQTKDAAALTLVCMASSSGNTCNLGIAALDAAGNLTNLTGAYTLDDKAATAEDGKIPVDGKSGHIVKIDLTAAATYCIYGQDSAINIYSVEVNYANGTDPVTCEVSFNTMGGMSVESQQVQSGETAAVPADSLRKGYTFAGWYSDYDCTEKYDFDTPVSGDMMLFAKWTEGGVEGANLVLDMKDLPTRSYTESFDWNGFNLIADAKSSMAVENKSVTIDEMTYTKRLKLSGTGSTSARCLSFTVAEESTLTVIAESATTGTARTLVVTDNNTNQNIADVDAAAKYTRDLTAGTWSVYSEKDGMNIYFIAVTPKGETVQTCTITVDKADGSTDEPTKLTVNAGVPVTETQIPTPERAGFTFTGWVDGDSNPISIPFTPEGDMTLTATWKEGEEEKPQETTVDVAVTISGELGTNKIVLRNGTTDTPVENGKSATLTIGTTYTVVVLDADNKAVDSSVMTAAINSKTTYKPAAGDKAITITVTPGTGTSPNPDPDPDPVNDEGLKVVLAETDTDYTYTGSAITPAITVTFNGEPLTAGTDYTVKYTNNTKASHDANGNLLSTTGKKLPTVTVTGKGNLTGSAYAAFDIKQKNIADSDVQAGSVVVVKGTKGSKIAPVLVYDSLKLTNKDYEIVADDKTKSFDVVGTETGTLTIKGKGNFTGSREIKVTVVESKKDLKKIKVDVPKKTYTFAPGTTQKLEFTVKSADSTDNTDLQVDKDYTVVTSGKLTEAGTVKVTVIGQGEYTGTVTKTFKINPLNAAVADFDAKLSKDSYEFVSTGVTFDEDDLTVTYHKGQEDAKELVQGQDYKITYSNNKKVSTEKSLAKYTITFLGNYKGSKAVSGTFKITPVILNDETEGLKIAAADKVYKKAGIYKSAPYVSINGVALKASDYTVSYYLDEKYTQEMKSGKGGYKVDLNGNSSQTIYVKITGKLNGNYAGDTTQYATTSYQVWSAADKVDLSKARITFKDGENKLTKAEYTGNEVEPTVVVEVKNGKKWETVPQTVEGSAELNYTVEYVNNVNKGKATVVVTGTGKYVGSKTATFSIVAQKVKNSLLSSLFHKD